MDLHECYELLEVPLDASRPEIKRQYRRLAKRWHPDRFPAGSTEQAVAAERMQRLNSAYKHIRHAPLRFRVARKPVDTGVLREPAAGSTLSPSPTQMFGVWGQFASGRYAPETFLVVFSTSFFVVHWLLPASIAPKSWHLLPSAIIAISGWAVAFVMIRWPGARLRLCSVCLVAQAAISGFEPYRVWFAVGVLSVIVLGKAYVDDA